MTESQRALVRLLDTAFGDESTGLTFVQSALREARRSALPADVDALFDFVRAHLVAPLTVELGPRLVSALLDDLSTELARSRPLPRPPTTTMSDAPKSSGVRLRPNVLLCDTDRLSRASLARSLLSESCDVEAVETPLDVMSHDGAIDVAILDMNVADVAAMLGALLSKQPDVRVIAITNDPSSAETLIRAAAVREHRIVRRGTRPQEIGALVKRLSVA